MTRWKEEVKKKGKNQIFMPLTGEIRLASLTTALYSKFFDKAIRLA